MAVTLRTSVIQGYLVCSVADPASLTLGGHVHYSWSAGPSCQEHDAEEDYGLLELEHVRPNAPSVLAPRRRSLCWRSREATSIEAGGSQGCVISFSWDIAQRGRRCVGRSCQAGAVRVFLEFNQDEARPGGEASNRVDCSPNTPKMMAPLK